MVRCISSLSFSVFVNENKYGFFKPKSGLRQEDHLSPYLFIFYTEGLSTMLRKKIVYQTLHGVRASQVGLEISRLLFTDNSLLFFKVIVEESIAILECLKMYEEASGQKVNLQKLRIIFSPNTPRHVKEEIQNNFAIRTTIVYEK